MQKFTKLSKAQQCDIAIIGRHFLQDKYCINCTAPSILNFFLQQVLNIPSFITESNLYQTFKLILCHKKNLSYFFKF